MGFKSIRTIAVKAIALISVTVVCTGLMSAHINPAAVVADDDLYKTLYDVFRDRDGDPDNFMSQEQLVDSILYYCDQLSGIEYTYGDQEHYLACDGFVSLVLRMTFGTVYNFERTRTKYWCKFDYHEEHILACSYVDKYEVYRPGGTSVTWLYKNYVNTLVEPLFDREYVEGMTNEDWAEYLEEVGAQPGDIMFWDDDRDKQYWTHISIYAGIEDGVPKMWHASSVKGYVCKQSLEEITCDVAYLDYCSILPMTDHPARVGLYVTDEAYEKDFSYSIYSDPSCTEYLGRISSVCDLSDQSYLENILIYPNDAHDSYDRTIYVKRDISPYTGDSGGSEVYQIIINVTPDDDEYGTITYSVYGAADVRYYCSAQITGYNYLEGSKVIPITDYR
ncbi:MAG: hypothetical protein K6E12_05740 [Saccharofermentans sp.]|nr:hypothetical protein [Saccharofermentans sp.]